MNFEDLKMSRKTSSQAKMHDITPLEMAYIDLVTAGWNRHDAYYTIFRRGWSWPVTQLDDAIAKIHEKEGFSSRRKVVRENFASNTISIVATTSEGIDPQNVTKESMIRELVMSKEGMKVGSKEWIDVQKMISDIMRLKQDEIKDDNILVHFFMPMKCHECPLFVESKRAKQA